MKTEEREYLKEFSNLWRIADAMRGRDGTKIIVSPDEVAKSLEELATLRRQKQLGMAAAIQSELTQVKDDREKCQALLKEISNWLVCSAIATPDDMAQSFEHFQKSIDDLLEGTLQ